MLEYLRGAVSVDVDVQQDGDRLRAADLVALLGDATRAREELGWKPRYKFEETLDSVLEFWRKQAASEPR